nr:hypothetical protein [Rhodoferax sp.]
MESVSDKRLGRAVELAAAFVANGDIRLQSSTRVESQGVVMLGELIETLYAKLGEVEQKVLL